MKVSIVLPTFNRGYCLQRAIDSVLAQTYPDWELLIVDDGSTDDTHTLLARFTDPRIRVFRHSLNRGVAAARNTALAAARGDFIAFLDSDDEWKPEKLAKQLDLMARVPHAPVGFTDVVLRGRDFQADSLARALPAFSQLLHQHFPTDRHVIIPQRTMYLCLLEELPIKTPTLMLRADVLSTAGHFDEQLRSGEDWEFLLRAARKFNFAYLDEPLTVVNRSQDGTHLRYFVEDKASFIRLLLRLRSCDRGDSAARAAARRGIVTLRKHLYWHYMASGDCGRAAASCLLGFAETASPGLLARAVRAAASALMASVGRWIPGLAQSH